MLKDHKRPAERRHKKRRPLVQEAETPSPSLDLKHLTPASILQLQRTIGNQATQRLMLQRQRPVISQSAQAAPRIQRVELWKIEKGMEPGDKRNLRAWLAARLGIEIDWEAYESKIKVTPVEGSEEGLISLDSQDPVNKFLDLFDDEDDVKQRVERWLEAKQGEKAEQPPVAEYTERVEAMIAKSQAGQLFKGRIRLDPKDVNILDDKAFEEAHFADVKRVNRGKFNGADQWEVVRQLDLAQIDLVRGFTDTQGKINLRKGVITDHFVIHETIHKLTGDVFEAKFGHLMNEGVTELIARSICGDNKIPFDPNAYKLETALVLAVFELKMGLGKGDYFEAYVSGDVSALFSRFEDWLWGDDIGGSAKNVASSVLTFFGKPKVIDNPVEKLVKEKDVVKALGIANDTPKLKA